MIIIEPKIYNVIRKELINPKSLLIEAGLEIGSYAESFITAEEFQDNVIAEKNINIQLVKFDKDYLIQDILNGITAAGFRLPNAQDAIWFATQYPAVQIEYPVAFLHKPWVSPETKGENVLILRNYSGNRYFHMHLFDSRWYAHVRFAVIKN